MPRKWRLGILGGQTGDLPEIAPTVGYA